MVQRRNITKTKTYFSEIINTRNNFFTVQNWKNNKKEVLKNIKHTFIDTKKISKFAIRSSSINEDNFSKSNAGKFESFLNVNLTSIEQSINKVIQSFDKNNFQNQIIVQPMVENVIANGVILTSSLETNSPHYTINFEFSNLTNSITSGNTINHTTIILRKSFNIKK